MDWTTAVCIMLPCSVLSFVAGLIVMNAAWRSTVRRRLLNVVIDASTAPNAWTYERLACRAWAILCTGVEPPADDGPDYGTRARWEP